MTPALDSERAVVLCDDFENTRDVFSRSRLNNTSWNDLSRLCIVILFCKIQWQVFVKCLTPESADKRRTLDCVSTNSANRQRSIYLPNHDNYLKHLLRCQVDVVHWVVRLYYRPMRNTVVLSQEDGDSSLSLSVAASRDGDTNAVLLYSNKISTDIQYKIF